MNRATDIHVFLTVTLLGLCLLLTAGIVLAQTYPVGDEVTVIQRPLLNIPAIVTPGVTLEISCDADPGTTDWTAALRYDLVTVPLVVFDASYD
ncbi:MAG: hypothetical protein ABIF77_17095, partial [bacterium]